MPLSRRVVTILTVLVVLVLFFLPFHFSDGGYEPSEYLFERLGDAFHFPFFLLFGALACWLVPPPGKTNYRLVFVVAMSVIVGIEIFQPLTGRSASLGDVVNGGLGLVFGMAFYRFVETRHPVRSAGGATLLALASLVTLGVLVPVYREYRIMKQSVALAPMLADFEEPWQRALWEPSTASPRATATIDCEVAAQGRCSLAVKTVQDEWSGVVFRPRIHNWREDESLELSIFRPADGPSSINVRIDDDKSAENFDERINYSAPLAPGWNRLTIPLKELASAVKARKFRLTRVTELTVFISPGPRPFPFFVDGVVLRR